MHRQKNENYYANHLSSYNDNEESSNVVLSEDIYNTDGQLVASKKLEVTQRVAQIIAKHNLVKPIENSILIQGGLSEGALIKAFRKKTDSLNISTSALHQQLLDDVKTACHALFRYPLVLQKLTILSKQLPQVYDKTLLCSLLSVGLGRELGLSREVKDNLLLANVISDLGLLHLPPELVLKESHYSFDEWKMMQGHIVIAKHLADSIPNLPKRIPRAILEHHERADGFGDPFGKTEDKLSIEGQILSMTDTIGTQHSVLVLNGMHSWNAVYDVVQVPTSSHAENIRKAALRQLKQIQSPFKAKYEAGDYLPVISNLKKKHECLNEWFEVITQILEIHNVELQEQNDFKPYTLLKELNGAIVTSGLLSSMQLDWLNSLSTPINKKDGFDIEEYELKLGVIEFECFFVMRKLRTLQDELAKRFNSEELARHYYTELIDILKQRD